MSASPDEIDENLDVLDQRSTSDTLRRYSGIMAVVLGVAVVAGAGVLIYRRMHGRTRKEQLQGTVIEGLKDLQDSVRRSAPGRWVMRRVG